MTVQTINKSSIAVFMDLDELSSEGICIEEINANRTMMLAKQAFQHIGLQIEGELEVEAYINQCIMVFASIRDKITDVYALYRFSALRTCCPAFWRYPRYQSQNPRFYTIKKTTISRCMRSPARV